MIFQFTRPILVEAERVARETGSLAGTLAKLRRLSLDNFGDLLFSMPNPEWPSLSRVLPSMATDDVQRKWTGNSGYALLNHTVAFARQIEINLHRAGKDPAACRFLDFGCGYGRFIRMLYYFTDASNIWGIDAWQESLDQCTKDRVAANFARSEARPTTLPVEDRRFDIAFAFSIFTHLSQESADACLRAVRGHIADDGLFIVTIRPREYWAFRDRAKSTDDAQNMQMQHDAGYAFIPQNGPYAANYGESSMPVEFFNRQGWAVSGYDTTLHDTYQVSLLLRPVP